MKMTDAHRFQNALRIMYSLDEVATVLRAEQADEFLYNPLRTALLLDQPTWAKVYALIEARQPADAVNQPVPDLLVDVDPRLGEIEQIGAHKYRYGDYIIRPENPAVPGIYWSWIDGKRGGGEPEHEGICESILACLNACDEHAAEMVEQEAEAERQAGLREMADDDKAHAAAERAKGI